jgi:hypothetical protein
LRERVAQTTVEDEGVYGDSEMVWHNQRFGQSILKLFVLSIYIMDHSMLCNVLGRSWICFSYAWEISPTLILYLLYLNQENKTRETKTSKGFFGFEHWGTQILLFLLNYY